MFYCSEILHQRRGQFAIIWLAATRGRKLTRRDFNSVNIVRTCDDIINYLLATSQKKRLSLYLSTQLMYGTLLIYKKQQDILMDDVSFLMTRFHKSISKEVEINLKFITRKDQVTHSNVLQRAEPGFGLLADSDTASVSEIPLVDVWKSIPCLQIPPPSPIYSHTSTKQIMSLPTSPHQPIEELDKFKPEYSPHTVAGTNITLKEAPTEEPFKVDEQLELPTMEYQDLQMIADQQLDQDVPQVPKTPEKIPTRIQETPKDAQPEEVIPDAPERHRPIDFDPNVTEEAKEPPRKKRPKIPAMILSPVVSSSGRPRKRRLLVDLETSLSREKIRKNLTHTTDILRDRKENRVRHDIRFHSSVKELFKYPLMKELNHKSLFHLWQRNLKAITDFEETESEKKQPIFSVPELRLSSTSGSSSTSEKSQERPRRKRTPVPEEVLPTETVRYADSLHSSDRAITPATVSLRKSADSFQGSISLDESMPKRRKADSRSLSEDELTTMMEDPIARRLEDELYPLPEEVPLDLSKVSLSPVRDYTETLPTADYSISHLLESIEKQTRHQDFTTFKEICPLFLPRNRAATMFYTLLVAEKEGYVLVQQNEPYGDIFIQLL